MCSPRTTARRTADPIRALALILVPAAVLMQEGRSVSAGNTGPDCHSKSQEDRPLAVVLIRSPYGRAGLAAILFAAPLARQVYHDFHHRHACGYRS
jgi:hypothetical protein